jgi:hypothetical protein
VVSERSVVEIDGPDLTNEVVRDDPQRVLDVIARLLINKRLTTKRHDEGNLP